MKVYLRDGPLQGEKEIEDGYGTHTTLVFIKDDENSGVEYIYRFSGESTLSFPSLKILEFVKMQVCKSCY